MKNSVEDKNILKILRQLKLTLHQVIEKNAKYIILKCIDKRNKSVVLKYCHTGSKETYRRISNEILFTKNVVPTDPLRFLRYYAHGKNYLVTEFENGIFLSPSYDYNYNAKIIKNIADALINFQLMSVKLREIGVRDCIGLNRFYLKMMLKHLIHLWPHYMSFYESIKCLWLLIASLPAIQKKHAVCHADFIPTNLIYNPDEECVIFLDLEGFLTVNHPLYDVISFCTVEEIDIREWEWQRHFMRYYLEKTKEAFGFDRQSREFKKVFHGIVIFFLVYWLNDTRIQVENETYFNGLTKWNFVLKKMKELFPGGKFNRDSQLNGRSLQIRKNNLTRMLSKRFYLKSLNWLLG